MSNTELQLKKLIINGSKKKNIEQESINENTDLLSDLFYDSISIIKLIVDIENIFNIEFNDSMLDFNMLTKFGELKNIVINKLDGEK